MSRKETPALRKTLGSYCLRDEGMNQKPQLKDKIIPQSSETKANWETIQRPAIPGNGQNPGLEPL
jgi:hypothetical protein